MASLYGCYNDSIERLYPKVSNPCDDTTVTFSSTVTTILQPCQSCHSNSNASSSGSGIKLENYADIMVSVKNGKLMGSINHTNGFVAMPNGGGKLPDCEIAQLQKWIDNNTPNN
jgi:cytochrome c5